MQRGERRIPTRLEEAPVQAGTWRDVKPAVSAHGGPGLGARRTPAVCFGRSRELKKKLKGLPDLLFYRRNRL